MTRTELIDFMMDFTKNPSLIISNCVIFDSLMSKLFFEPINNLYFIEIKDNTATCSTWDISDLIGLKGDLNLMEFGNKWDHKMKPWLSPCV